MEIIQIKVDVTGGASALAQIEKIEKAVSSLNQKGTRVNVDVNASGIDDTSKAFSKLSGSIDDAGKSTASFMSRVKSIAQQRLINAAINAVTTSFKDALDTMKAVDDELVTVRKVTNATAQELEAIEKQAYKTASAYGVAADEYLASVAAFARAGYDDQSEALAELATKTQLVGDTTAETAQQFLLSVDAAYKYNGAVSELQKVLDGANEIDNNYATSIEKIAEGLGKVAPIASQAHVGVGELSSAIGTITAATQRSGTEAATALRALFLNIIGDTKTEIEEGVTWTTGEIAGLRDVIKEYASEAYEAAQATGSVINPMEAIAGLAQSMEDGVLTEQKLMSMVSDIGGKLRSAQLLALIQNWDMYESMLEDFGNAAGSADKEVENALDSWTRKTNILKNTWTELVNETVSTDWIKGLIDDVTTLIASFDDLGDMALNVGGIIGGLKLAKSGLNMSGGLSGILGGIAGSGAGAALSGALPYVGAAVAAFSAINTAVKVYKQNLEETAEETAKIAEESAAHAETIADIYTAYKTAAEGTQEFTDAQENLKNALYESNEYANALMDTPDDLALVEIYNASDDAATAVKAAEKSLTANYRNAAERNAPLLGDYASTLAETFGSNELQEKVMDALKSGLDYSENGDFFSLREGASGIQDYYETLLNIQKIFIDFATGNPNSGILSTSFYEGITSQIDQMKDSVEGYASAVETQMKSDAMKEFASFLKREDVTSEDVLTDYINGVRESSEYSEEFKEIIYNLAADAFPEYAEAAGIAEYATEALTESQSEGNEETDRYSEHIKTLAAVMGAMSDTLGVVQTAFEDFGENGRISLDTLNEIIESFGDLDNLDDYIERLTDAGLESDELNRIMSEMTIAYARQMIAANNLTEADAAYVEEVLRQAGVVDADKVAVELLTGAFEDDKTAAERAARAHEAIEKAGLDLSSVRIELGATVAAWNAAADAANRYAKAAGLGLSSKEMNSAVQANLYDSGDYAAGSALNSRMHTTSNRTTDYSHLSYLYDPSKWGGTGSGGSGGSGGGGSSSSSEEEDIYGDKLDALEDYLQAKEKLIEIDRREGATTDDLISRYREMQGRIHDLAEEYRAANNVEDDDYTYALKDMWWEYADEIQGLYADRVSLLESELDVLEAQNADVDVRADKMREIAAAMKRQIDYMESIGADQREINSLTAKWYSLQNDVNELLEEAARERMQELIDAAENVISTLREAQLGALDDQLSKLQAARDTQKQMLDIQEKQLAVARAKEALENAKRERTVRYFNAETNQWEWMADAGAVKDAEEALEDAENDLAKAYADMAYDAAVQTIEKEKEAVEKAYDAFEDAWDDAAKSVLDGSMTLTEAFEMMAGLVARIAEETGVDLSDALKKLANSMNFDLTTMHEANRTATLPTGETVPIYINENGQTETKGLVAGTIVHTGGGDYEITGGSSILEGGDGYTSTPLFDGGGILRGMGGIKATSADEMILDPELTGAMLAPNADRTFRERAALLGYMFGAGGKYNLPPDFRAAGGDGTTYNGHIYNFGNISLSEQQAKSMTVYDLARLAGSLHVYTNS